MMRRALCLALLPLAGCSLSNAFFNLPDFQQQDNRTACVDFQNAISQASQDCSPGNGFQLNAESLCPERLNELDPLCASYFQCKAETLLCEDGFPREDPSCDEAFPGLRGRCTDPFDNVEVTVSFSIDFADVEDCASAGVVELAFDVIEADGSGASSTGAGPCTEESFTAFETKSSFPARIFVFGLDGPFDDFGNRALIYESDEIFVPLETISEDNSLDLGIITLQPRP
jgi:hypothetical protein